MDTCAALDQLLRDRRAPDEATRGEDDTLTPAALPLDVWRLRQAENANADTLV